jgi:hypothetical protein
MVFAFIALSFFAAIDAGMVPPDANWHPTKGVSASE